MINGFQRFSTHNLKNGIFPPTLQFTCSAPLTQHQIRFRRRESIDDNKNSRGLEICKKKILERMEKKVFQNLISSRFVCRLRGGMRRVQDWLDLMFLMQSLNKYEKLHCNRSPSVNFLPLLFIRACHHHHHLLRQHSQKRLKIGKKFYFISGDPSKHQGTADCRECSD